MPYSLWVCLENYVCLNSSIVQSCAYSWTTPIRVSKGIKSFKRASVKTHLAKSIFTHMMIIQSTQAGDLCKEFPGPWRVVHQHHSGVECCSNIILVNYLTFGSLSLDCKMNFANLGCLRSDYWRQSIRNRTMGEGSQNWSLTMSICQCPGHKKTCSIVIPARTNETPVSSLSAIEITRSCWAIEICRQIRYFSTTRSNGTEFNTQ